MVKETKTTEYIKLNEQYVTRPTFNELYEAYLKLSKEELAMLLAAKESAAPYQQPYVPAYPVYPSYTAPSPYPWNTWDITC